MRAFLLIALAACATESPHDIEPCEGWNFPDGFEWMGTCEAACVTQPPNFGVHDDGTECTAVTASGQTQSCSSSFEAGGERGCCILDLREMTLAFATCTEEP